MKHQVALLIKTLNGQIQQLPGTVKLMVHQYTVKSYVMAWIWFVLFLILLFGILAIFLRIRHLVVTSEVKTKHIKYTHTNGYMAPYYGSYENMENREPEEINYPAQDVTEYDKEVPAKTYSDYDTFLIGLAFACAPMLISLLISMHYLSTALNPIMSIIKSLT